MEGRATHSAIPAAVSPQLIPHKAERFNAPVPCSFPTYLRERLWGRAGGRAQPRSTARPRCEPRARPRSPGRGESFAAGRSVGAEPWSLCAAPCFAQRWFSGWDQARKQQVWLCISSHPSVGVYSVM